MMMMMMVMISLQNTKTTTSDFFVIFPWWHWEQVLYFQDFFNGELNMNNDLFFSLLLYAEYKQD